MSLADPLIGRQLGDYRIVDILGRGGMAHVYRGFDQKLQRYAAVKVIDANLLARDNEDEYRQRFQREARAVAKLNHPNIVGVYQFGEADSLYYMAMAFIDGRDLGHILKEHTLENTLLPHDQVLRVVHDIGGALDYAHAGGVIHRDVKPSNIMVTTDNRAILTDFGLALSVPEGTQGNTFGSAHYIAPEQAISSANAIPQSDLYSLGVVIFQMLTGKMPFDDPSAMSVALKHLSEAPPSPRSLNPALSPAVERVVLKALEKEPSKRYPSGAALTQALEQALALDPPASAASHPSRLLTPFALWRDGTGSKPTPKFSEAEIMASQMRVKRAQRLLSGTPRRRSLLIGALAAVIVLIAAFAIWTISHNSAVTPTALAAVVKPTDTSTPAPTQTSTAAPTRIPASTTLVPVAAVTVAVTVRPSAAPPLIVPTTDAPTSTPSPTASIPPSATPSGVVNPGAPVQLIYDTDKLVLVNRADHAVSIRDWSFVQQTPQGNVTFYAAQWESPTLGTVQPNTCYLIWRNSLSEVATPDYCVERAAWYAAGTLSRFWLSDQAGDSFRVFGSTGALLATCPVNQGECGVTPDES